MTQEEVAAVAELTDGQRSDLLALANPNNPFGGLFDALSPGDSILFKRLGLIRSYIPAGCMAPLTKVTTRGRRWADYLRGDQPC